MSYKWNEKIKKIRNDSGMTQQQLSEKLGVSRGTLANWELGRREPSADVFMRYAEMFNVSLDYLHDKPVNTSEIKSFMRDIETFLMSETVQPTDKDSVIKDIMALYFKAKTDYINPNL